MLLAALKFARALEKYNLMSLEDMLTSRLCSVVQSPGLSRDHNFHLDADPHGEKIYLRHNFKELIETQTVRVTAP